MGGGSVGDDCDGGIDDVVVVVGSCGDGSAGDVDGSIVDDDVGGGGGGSCGGGGASSNTSMPSMMVNILGRSVVGADSY